MKQSPYSRKLEHYDYRYSQHKTGVSRFVADDIHRDKHNRATSQKCQQKKGKLTDPVLGKLHRRYLIIYRQNERQCRHGGNINEKIFQFTFSLQMAAIIF